MKAKKIFTDYELAILKALWGAGKPLARPQILERIAEEEMNPTTFHFAMNNLIEKGCAGIAGFERCGAGYGRTYEAKKSQEEFVLDMFRETRPEGTKEKGVRDFMLAFIEKEPLDEATISELEDMLAQRRKMLQQEKESNQANDKDKE